MHAILDHSFRNALKHIGTCKEIVFPKKQNKLTQKTKRRKRKQTKQIRLPHGPRQSLQGCSISYCGRQNKSKPGPPRVKAYTSRARVIGTLQGKVALGGEASGGSSRGPGTKSEVKSPPGLASNDPLPLAWPRSHLVAPWHGFPATWTDLIAFRIREISDRY